MSDEHREDLQPDGLCRVCGLPGCGAATVEAGLAALAAAPAPVAPPFHALARVSRAQRRRRAVRKWARRTALAALLATSVAAMALWVAQPRRLMAGETLDALARPEVAVLASGARLTLSVGSATVAAASPPGMERLVLDSGTVSLEVPRLAPGFALVVQTPDAEITVHGTRFEVSRENGGTRVRVSEGLVEVAPRGKGRAPRMLGAQQSVLVEPLEVAQERLQGEAAAAVARGEWAAARAAVDALLATEPASVQAGEAYALAAFSARAEGREQEAVTLYRRALEKLEPGTTAVWADTAAAELAQLIERLEPRDAVQAWREYLARFPDGVHAPAARDRLNALASSR